MFRYELRIAILLFSIIFLQASLANLYAADISPWKSVCPDGKVMYCKNVGKHALSLNNSPKRKGEKLGKIVGVAWRAKGMLINTTCPQATSPEDGYYYIIDDGIVGTVHLLRQSGEVDVREVR